MGVEGGGFNSSLTICTGLLISAFTSFRHHSERHVLLGVLF